MPVTLEEVRKLLSSDEPDYETALTTFGSDALPHLETLFKAQDISLASKAISLASMIPDSHSLTILTDAAKNTEPILRIAAATGERNFISSLTGTEADVDTKPITDLLNKLKNDPDPGVNREANKSLESIDTFIGDIRSKKKQNNKFLRN